MTQPVDQPSAFYDALAPMFDVMTDWDARLREEGPFLRHALEGVGALRVLDAACGSGGHALALAEWGYQVTGADASPRMIDLARNKATMAGKDIPFLVASLGELSQHLSKPFDVVLCLGNSLPHLLSQADLVAALRDMAAVLRPGGLLITHNLNYDLRWQTQPRFFAAQGGVLDGQEVLVWRFADYLLAESRIAFHIALFRKGATGWDVQVHTTPQRPLFHADLTAALGEAGFDSPRAYGQLLIPPPPFDPAASPDLVILAHKRTD